jgi:hypothetical protein
MLLRACGGGQSTLIAPYKPSARHLKFAQFDGTHILSAEFADEVAKVKNNV